MVRLPVTGGSHEGGQPQGMKEILMKMKLNGIAPTPRVLVSPGAERRRQSESDAERSAVLA